MTLTLDKNLASERSLSVNTVDERLVQKRLTAQQITMIDGSFPSVDDFGTDPHFTTLEITDGNVEYPIVGTYNTVTDFAVSYNEISHRFSVMLSLGYTNE